MKYLIGVVIVVLVVFGWRWYSEDRKCEEMALNASVEEINPRLTSDVNQRAFEQKQYQERYKEACKSLR